MGIIKNQNNSQLIPMNNNYKPLAFAKDGVKYFEPINYQVPSNELVNIDCTYNHEIDVLKIEGKSVQNGTATPENPIDIESVEGELIIRGKNLFDINNVPLPSTIPSMEVDLDSNGFKTTGYVDNNIIPNITTTLKTYKIPSVNANILTAIGVTASEDENENIDTLINLDVLYAHEVKNGE